MRIGPREEPTDATCGVETEDRARGTEGYLFGPGTENVVHTLRDAGIHDHEYGVVALQRLAKVREDGGDEVVGRVVDQADVHQTFGAVAGDHGASAS